MSRNTRGLSRLVGFVATGQAMHKIAKTVGIEGLNQPENKPLFDKLLASAPDDMRTVVNRIALQSGLFPKEKLPDAFYASFCTIEETATAFGVSAVDVMQILAKQDLTAFTTNK